MNKYIDNDKYVELSVLMSLYIAEKPKYFEQALNSLYIQSVLPSEILLVIDGPIGSDLSAVIHKWSDKLPLRCLYLSENVGLSHALNVGLKACKNELVARFDTDDICHSNRLEKQFFFMKKNLEVDICGGFAKFIDKNGLEYDERILPTEHENIKKLIWSCPLIHPSVIFRKSRILSIGSYSLNAPHRQDDYDLWIRAANSELRFHNINEFLISYRYNQDDFKKNTVNVGWNRFKIGIIPWYKYDRRISSFFGLLYPLVRASIPLTIALKVNNFVKSYDPRRH